MADNIGGFLDGSQYNLDTGQALNQVGQNSLNNLGVSSYSGPVNTPPILQPSMVQGTTPITVPPPITDNGSGAAGIVAGAGEGVKTMQDYLKMLTPDTTTQSQYKDTTDRITKLMTDMGQKGNDQLKAEQDAGIPVIKQQLTDITNQVRTRIANYNAAFQELENQPQQIASVVGTKQQQLQRTEAADIGLLNARAEALQGNLTSALDIANRAIDLKYYGIESEIATKKEQLNFIKDRLSVEESRQARALELKLNDDLRVWNEKKEEEKINKNYALTNKIAEPYFYRGDELIKTSDGTPVFKNDAGTMVRLSDGKRYSSSAQFFADSGISNWNQIHVNTSIPTKFETVTIGSGKGSIKVRFGYDNTGQVVSAVNLNTGQPYPINGKAPVSSPSTPSTPTPVPTPSNTKFKTATPAAVNAMRADFTPGTDGGVHPNQWNANLKKWLDAGYTLASFKTNFGSLAKNSAANSAGGSRLSQFNGM